VVVAKPGHIVFLANILAALKTTVANFKLPKRCVVVPELPRNAMGKVQKNMLRAQFGHLLATGAS
jgi:malonyl-CoA/methylmalonyl-CoA synthetase